MTGQAGVDGTPFGRYRLVALLGRGGMGEVWRGHDTETDRVVAIKLLPSHFSESQDFKQRFRREAHAAAQLNTPHVIPIHNYGEIDGRLYVDMRLIEGRDLEAVLADGPMPPSRAVRIIEQVALALHAAHKVGLLHRDVKPSNILLDDNDFAYLIDFGIARAADETRLTKSGNTIGSFHYIAPERLGRTEEDARADIYSLACVLYECLTGSPPFDEGTMAHLVVAHLNTPPPRPSIAEPSVPEQIDQVIATGMAKDPDQRYATTVEFAGAARDAISVPVPRPAPSPPPIAPIEDATSPTAGSQPTGPAGPSAPTRHPSQPSNVGQQPTWLASTEQPPFQPPAQPPSWPVVGAAGQPPPPPSWAPPQQPPGPVPARRSRTPWIIAGIATVALLIAAVGIFAIVRHPKSPTSQPAPTSQGAPIAAAVLPFTGLNSPSSVAVDSAATAYVADYVNRRVVKLAAGSSTQTVLPFTGLSGPWGVAVDNVGSVYVTDVGNNRVLKLAAGSTTQSELPFTGLDWPSGVAVDRAGNVYVSDDHNNRVLKLAAGSTTQIVLPFTGLSNPRDVAVDSAGNVYEADYSGRVLKLAPGATTQIVLPFTGISDPWGVAVDSLGNVYVSDQNNNRVLKLAAGSTTQSVLPFTGLNNPVGVAVSSVGYVYVCDDHNNRVLWLTQT